MKLFDNYVPGCFKKRKFDPQKVLNMFPSLIDPSALFNQLQPMWVILDWLRELSTRGASEIGYTMTTFQLLKDIIILHWD